MPAMKRPRHCEECLDHGGTRRVRRGCRTVRIGKSTLLSCLAGLDEPDGGTVRIDGTGSPVDRRPNAPGSGPGWSACSRRATILLSHLTVAQNIALARRLASNATARGSVNHLDALGLAHRAGARPGTLSGGEAVRAGLAVALANDPPVLLADEPTGELDSGTEAQVLALLTRRAHDGTALLVASHSAAVAAAADRVITLRGGELS